MGVKISELPEATSVQEEDIMPIVQNGETKKVSMSKVGGNEVFIGDTEEAPDTAKIIIDDEGVETYGLEVSISPTEPTSKTGVWLKHGKNLFDGYNLPKVTAVGVTATPNGSKITLTGTSNTAGGVYTTQYLCYLKAGTYKLSSTVESGNTSGSGGYALMLRDKDGNSLDPVDNVYTLANDIPVYFRIFVSASGLTFNNLVLKIQLEKGSTATEYEDFLEDKQYVLNNGQYEEFNSGIESGINENGNYIKYSDGNMICYGTLASTGSGWATVTFPVQFISTPVVTTGGNSGTNETSTLMVIKTANIGISSFRTCRVLTSGYDSGRVDWIAIGRWK